MASAAAVSCVVADDHPAVLDAVSRFLAASGIDVVGTARDGDEALEQIEKHRPDVALVDVSMPRLGGVEVAKRAHRSSPGTKSIVYTGLGDKSLLTECLDAGARGFVLKEAPLPDLVRAVRMVAGAGETYVDPALAVELLRPASERVRCVTAREREVLRLLADGLSNEEIGRRLFISGETVRTHVRKAMEKLGADTRTQAVATALRQSLIA